MESILVNHTRLILRCESVRLLVFVPLSTIKPSVGSFDAAVERKSGRWVVRKDGANVAGRCVDVLNTQTHRGMSVFNPTSAQISVHMTFCMSSVCTQHISHQHYKSAVMCVPPVFVRCIVSAVIMSVTVCVFKQYDG